MYWRLLSWQQKRSVHTCHGIRRESSCIRTPVSGTKYQYPVCLHRTKQRPCICCVCDILSWEHHIFVSLICARHIFVSLLSACRMRHVCGRDLSQSIHTPVVRVSKGEHQYWNWVSIVWWAPHTSHTHTPAHMPTHAHLALYIFSHTRTNARSHYSQLHQPLPSPPPHLGRRPALQEHVLSAKNISAVKTIYTARWQNSLLSSAPWVSTQFLWRSPRRKPNRRKQAEKKTGRLKIAFLLFCSYVGCT